MRIRLLPSHPLETLLRPPVELISAGCFLLIAVGVVMAPEFFLLNHRTSWVVSAGLMVLVFFRVAQATYLLFYRKNLSRIRAWRLPFNRIPQAESKLFLGKGFTWTAKHAQRLKETQTPQGQRYIKIQQSREKRFQELITSGRSEIHGVELSEKPVWLNRADRVGHTLVLGTTRVGKTRLAELLITQDIHNQEVVIVFDPKGDLELLFRMVAEAKRCGREKDLLVFHLGYPDYSFRYNAIGRFSRITEVATRIANQLPDSGNSAAFKEFAWRFVNIIAGALVALNQTPNYLKIRQYINDIEPLFIEYARVYLHTHAESGWAKKVKERIQALSPRTLPTNMRGRNVEAVALYQVLQQMSVEDAVLEGLMSAYKYDRTYFDKIVSSVGPLMEKLTTGAIAELISPDDRSDDHRPTLEWLEAISSKKIVYVGLDALSDQTVASAVGNSMFADLVSVAGHIYKFGTGTNGKDNTLVSIHADEFNELIGDEFVPLLNKAGGAGFQVTAYTQTWSDVLARVKQPAKAGQVAGNFNTLLMLRVRELATAEMLTSQLPRISLIGKSTSSGASDRSGEDSELDFETSHSDSVSKSIVPLVDTPELFSLPRGHAFALLDGGRIWKLRIPLPSQEDALLPTTIEQAFAAIYGFDHKAKLTEVTDTSVREQLGDEEVGDHDSCS